jgi:hypothetical protein
MLTKHEQQANVEQVYSRKNIRGLVREDVNPEHAVYKDICLRIAQYMMAAYTYYDSKKERVLQLAEIQVEDIATELLAVVLPIQEVSPIQSLASQLGLFLGYDNIMDGVKTGAELIAVCEQSGAYTIYKHTDELNETGTLSVRSNFKLDDKTADLIAKTKYLPPMLCKPNDWQEGNKNGGALQGSGSCILGSMNHHNGNQSLDVLNILQDIPWQLNEMVDYVEKSNKDLDTHDKLTQFELMKNQSTIVYNELMDGGNRFHFSWKNDSRGRMYSQGYHCHLQGPSYKKAILDFYEEELIV